MTIAELERRLEEVECAHGRLKKVVLGLTLLLVGGTAFGMAVGEAPVVRTSRLELVDSTGTIRGWLGVMPNGSTEFRLQSGKDGGQRVLLSAGPEGTASIGIRSSTTGRRVELGSDADEGHTGLSIVDREGWNRIIIGVLHDDSPRTWLVGKEGKGHCKLEIPADGSPRVLAQDRDGKPVEPLSK